MISLLLPSSLVAALAFVALITTPVIGFVALMPFALLKFLVPLRGFRKACGELAIAGAQLWPILNRLVYRLLYPVAWEIELRGELDPNKSYLLICNHQSIIDILLLTDIFHRRVPFPRFFLKRELLWVPVIGLGCWALEMPFMKRHSKEALKNNPELKREDLETARKFCERYREIPVTVVNFVEGTRFSEAKRIARQSPFRHLLRPKSAGMRIALDSMGDQFAGIINVTIAYRPTKYPLVWSFLTGEQNQLALHAEILPVPKDLMAGVIEKEPRSPATPGHHLQALDPGLIQGLVAPGAAASAYEDDADFRARFQGWINGIWARKDARLDTMLARSSSPAVRPRTT